jgi:DNA-binding HxlR family transcriptional regulator
MVLLEQVRTILCDRVEKETIVKKQWHTENPLKCPMVKALNVIGGRWKPIILHMLLEETMRFGQLRKKIPPVTQKMLTQQLRELEADGIIKRQVFAEVPPRVEYSMTAKGRTLEPILNDLYDWGSSLRNQ